jgi:hypothetical protein
MHLWVISWVDFCLRFQYFARRNPYATEQGFFSRRTGNYQGMIRPGGGASSGSGL